MSLLLDHVDPLFIATLILCATLTAFIYSSTNRRQSLLPPGPRGHWLLGYDIPKAFAYRHFETLAKTYGPVYTLAPWLPFYNPPIVVVNRVDAAIHILEKNGASTSDRPRIVSAGEILSGGMRVLLTPQGERFKKLRKALHSHLQPKSVAEYAPLQERYAMKMVLDIMNDPEGHQEHAKLYSASLVMSLAYGLNDPRKNDDPIVLAVNRCLVRLGVNLRPGLWKVDAFPILKYLPGYPLDELRRGHEEELNLFKTQLENLRKRVADPDLPPPPPCFGIYCLDRQKEFGLSDNEVSYLAGSMFGAGSDTTASAISITVLASLLYPHFQAALHRELDALPQDKITPPSFKQIDSFDLMPRLHAFVWETFRWRPVTAGGFVHKAQRDVTWQDTIIPAGSHVIGNVWAVCRDPDYFPDPETFNPSRWLETDDGAPIHDGEDVFCSGRQVKLKHDLKSKALYTFGFGRRVCPGQWIATRSTLITCALMHWAFEMKPHPKQEAIDPLDFTHSANAHPMPFKVHFADRLGGGIRLMEERFEGFGER